MPEVMVDKGLAMPDYYNLPGFNVVLLPLTISCSCYALLVLLAASMPVLFYF